ncbi:MAG: HRDC domain-containing protein [Salibacteraceae bacterium]
MAFQLWGKVRCSQVQVYCCNGLLAYGIRKPAYVVFSEASLRNMAAKAPLAVAKFMHVNGVGAHKAKRFAIDFLNTIVEFKRMGRCCLCDG